MLHNDNSHLFSIMQSLEDRILYDAVPTGLPNMDPLEQNQQPPVLHIQPATVPQHSAPQQIVFVDGAVENSDLLLSSCWTSIRKTRSRFVSWILKKMESRPSPKP